MDAAIVGLGLVLRAGGDSSDNFNRSREAENDTWNRPCNLAQGIGHRVHHQLLDGACDFWGHFRVGL